MEWRIRGNDEGGSKPDRVAESPKSLLPQSKVTKGRNGSLKEGRGEVNLGIHSLSCPLLRSSSLRHAPSPAGREEPH